MLRMEHICCDSRVVLATAGSWPPVQCWPGARRCGSELFLTTNPKSTIRTTPQRVWQAPPPHPKTITQGCSGSGSGGSESGLKFWWTTSYPPLPTIGMPTRRDCFYLMLFQRKLNNCSIQVTTYIAATVFAETTALADQNPLTTQFYLLLAESPRTKNSEIFRKKIRLW